MRLQQHRNIEVSGATLECTLYGSGTPVVLLANAGCSTGYFCDLARVLAAGGLQTISVNMRGVGESRGSLDGITVHDLAADVAGVLEAMDCGPAHLVGHAFGNRVARCLAVDRPSLVRSVTLLAAGGLIGPATPLGTSFRNATEVKMNGSDCVTVLGARWLSPASDPKILRGSNAGRRSDCSDRKGMALPLPRAYCFIFCQLSVSMTTTLDKLLAEKQETGVIGAVAARGYRSRRAQ